MQFGVKSTMQWLTAESGRHIGAGTIEWPCAIRRYLLVLVLVSTSLLHRATQFFGWGSKNMNDFSIGEAKIGGKTIKTIKFKS